MDLLTQAPPALVAMLGANGAIFLWLIKVSFSLGQELKGIKLTIEFLKKDLALMHEFVESYQAMRERMYFLSHEDARRFLHYHTNTPDESGCCAKGNNIKRI